MTGKRITAKEARKRSFDILASAEERRAQAAEEDARHGLSIDDLARAQGVGPCKFEQLAGTWPGGADDGFEDAIDAHRHPEEHPHYGHSVKPIWEQIVALGKEIPESEWANVPTDLAMNLHHYLYGAPKEIVLPTHGLPFTIALNLDGVLWPDNWPEIGPVDKDRAGLESTIGQLEHALCLANKDLEWYKRSASSLRGIVRKLRKRILEIDGPVCPKCNGSGLGASGEISTSCNLCGGKGCLCAVEAVAQGKAYAKQRKRDKKRIAELGANK